MLQPLQRMIIYECNMLIGDELIILVLHKDDHMQNMKNEKMKRAHVNINIWKIFCVSCNKWKVKCVDVLCEGEKLNWNFYYYYYVFICTIIFNILFVLMFNVLHIFLIHMTTNPFNITILYAFLFIFPFLMFAFSFMK